MAQPLLLLHIPKTAGTTLSRMLRLHWSVQPSNWLRHARTLGYYHVGYAKPEHIALRMNRIAQLSSRQLQQVRFFAAHAGFGLHELLPEPIRTSAWSITVLREPVSRMVSTFRHLRAEGRLSRDATLQSYLRQQRHFGLFKFDNCQTRYLAGERGVAVDVPPGRMTADMVRAAKQRLEHDLAWFGLTERFDESVLLLCDMIGWHAPRYVKARVAQSPDREPVIEDALVRQMHELNALDIELYAHAQGILDQRINQQGNAFAQRVEQFRVANARHARFMAPFAAVLPALRTGMQKVGVLR